MMSDGIGNATQTRAIAEQVGKAAADAAIRDFVQQYPHFVASPSKTEIPTPLKWTAGIAATITSGLLIAAIVWITSTLNQLQITVARIDERQIQDTTGKRVEALEARVTKLEQERVSR